MNKLPSDIRLLLVFIVLLTGLLLVHFRYTSSVPLEEVSEMEDAAALANQWFGIIKTEKETRGILSDARSPVPNNSMIGDEYTFLTTTLGSLESKEISTNPDFAALVVRLLHEAGAVEGDKIGVILSGSFPALAVSALAALQVMRMEVVMMSSLGASSYGANQPGATWIDMEEWLREKGGLRYRSALITAGAENDRGEGLQETGKDLIREAVDRNKRELYIPEDLTASIHHRMDILEDAQIRVLINIGGNQAVLGSCPHSSTLPNGLQINLTLCNHPDRGIMQDINARGVPVINMLNISELAVDYGIDPVPGIRYTESDYLYTRRTSNRWAIAVTLCTGFVAMGLFFRKIKTHT